MSRVSVIATVLNEEGSIDALLRSLMAQTRPPDEIVIADGGSHDGTVAAIVAAQGAGAPIRLIELPGANISMGRNAAILAASGDIIACTDAGVRLEPTWLHEIVAPFCDPGNANVDVVSGFFNPDPRTIFEAAMGATVLPDVSDVDPEKFLPSSRSVAFRKRAWQSVGGYPEWLDYCEDVVFDLALREAGCRFVFNPSARVHFRPRGSLRSFFKQYFQYARGDGKANLWPRRHLIRYGTYLLAPVALSLGLWYKGLWFMFAIGAAFYLSQPYRRLWPSIKGGPLVGGVAAIMYVPLIRLIGDVAKMAGYPVGLWWRWVHRSSIR
ncbi:MAG TPA: glycosyltransferase [Chloroflexota bacterium]|nr:glycosyltransferase [Chloroflexota bacterium]